MKVEVFVSGILVPIKLKDLWLLVKYLFFLTVDVD